MDLNIRKAAFKRLFKGKTKVPYKLYVKGSEFKINLRLRWHWKFFNKFIESLSKQTKKNITLPEFFKGSPKAHAMMLKNLKSIVDKIVLEEQKKLRNFKILSNEIEMSYFQREQEDIVFYITLKGICQYDI